MKLRDRDVRVIHKERLKVKDCSCEWVVGFDATVKLEDIACHTSRPLSWDAPTKPFLPDSIFEDIEEALELASEGRLVNQNDHLFRCIRPTLAIFGDTLHDAWSVLNGVTEAAGRYTRVLNAICATGEGGCGGETGVGAYW